MRYRYHLVSHRSSCKTQIHGVMAKNGILPARKGMWGEGGYAQLDSLELPDAYAARIDSLRDLIDIYDREIAVFDSYIHRQLKDDPGYQAIQKMKVSGE